MSHRVRVAPQGARDLARILDWLGKESPQAAQDFSDRFSEVVDALTRFDTGRATRDRRYRILNMHPPPFLIFLRRRHDDIEIVAIRLGNHNPRTMPARPR